MTTITATNMKQSFGNVLKNIKSEPIIITKRRQNYAVLVDYNEYKHLKQLEEHEDILFGIAAEKALKDGMASINDTNDLLNSIK